MPMSSLFLKETGIPAKPYWWMERQWQNVRTKEHYGDERANKPQTNQRRMRMEKNAVGEEECCYRGMYRHIQSQHSGTLQAERRMLRKQRGGCTGWQPQQMQQAPFTRRQRNDVWLQAPEEGHRTS